MPSNTTLNAGAGGDVITTKQRTHDGDTTLQQVVSVAGVTGTEDAYTHTDIEAGGGTEANALRVTIANDSTGVVTVDDGGTTISVDDGAGSLTVDGTVTANAGTGTFTVDGSGVTQPVSGTVTANLGATDNAVLDAIDSNTDYGAVTGGGAELGALRVTIANDSTGVVSVDDNGGSLTVDGTVTANAGTGTFTVDLGANNDVTIDGSSVVGTTDAVAPASPTGIPFLMERDDALSALTPIEGDWVQPRCDANGALWVNASNAGGTATDDAAFAVASDTVAVMGALADDTATDSVDEGDVGAVRMSLDRRLLVDADISDNGGSITVDNAGTFVTQVDGAALTALQTIDNPVFADDSAFTLGSSSVSMAGAIRDDALSALTAIEGDAVPLRVNSTGALHVTGAGGGTQYNVDDAAGATDTGTVSLAVRDDALTTLTPIDGDYVPLRVNSTGALHVTGGGGGTEYNEDDATPATITGTATMMERDDALATLTPIEGDWAAQRCNANGALWTAVDGTVAATQSGTWNIGTVTAVTDITNTVTVDNGGTFAVQAAQSGTWTLGANSGVDIGDVTINNAAGASAVNIQDGGNSITVDNGGTFATQISGSALTALQLIDNPVLAHDTAVGTTQVSMAGARATNSIEGLTQVAANDGTRVTSDLNGCLVTRPHTTPEEHISERISDTAGTSTAFTNFNAGGVGIHNYVTDITVLNTSATDGYVDIRDGAAGAILWTLPLPANGGATHSFSLPLKGAANTALAYDVSAALTTVYISVNGFQAQG